MSREQEWHHCATFAGDAGACDIVFDGRTWEMQDGEFSYGAVFQHGTTLTIVFCPFCGVRLGQPAQAAAPERLLGPDGQWYTVVGGWHAGSTGEGK